MPDKNGKALPGEPGYYAWGAENWDPARDWTGNVFGPSGNAFGSAEQDPFHNGDLQRGWKQWDGDGNGPGTRERLWNKLNGSYDAQRPTIDNQAGQTGPAQQAGTAFAMGPQGAQDAQSRAAQMQLIQQLQDQAAGRGPSIAQAQLQKGTEQNMSQAMALGASQRGAGAAGMNRGIANQQAQIGQGMANDAAMLRSQEQMQARGALGQNLGQMRGQDQGFAGMDLQNQQFNAGQYNQGQQFNAGQGNSLMNSNADRAAAAREAQAKIDLEMEKLRQENAQKSSPMGMLGGMFGGMAMSDRTVKTDIEPGDDALYSFLDTLGAHEYAYKDKKHGKGRRVSPMAQEIEKTDLGSQFVFDTEDGKAVDYGKMGGTMLAAQASLHKRLKKLGV